MKRWQQLRGREVGNELLVIKGERTRLLRACTCWSRSPSCLPCGWRGRKTTIVKIIGTSALPRLMDLYQLSVETVDDIVEAANDRDEGEHETAR